MKKDNISFGRSLRGLGRRASVAALVGLMLAQTPAIACTTLMTRDASGGVYHGRTLELASWLPYNVVYVPAGTWLKSSTPTDADKALQGSSRYRVLAITVPVDAAGSNKVVEGVNEEGLSFSALMYAGAVGPQVRIEQSQKALAAADLGAWGLSQFKNVAEVKAAMANQPVWLAGLAVLGGLKTPLHYIFYDRAGNSIVIEFADGKQSVNDNPIGVMTNGPELSWHLTNLNNYSFLTNVDKSTGSFNGVNVAQPDSGIATAGLPASNTSVGRFVRAAYYSTYVEKAKDPDTAIVTLAHVMNNFDRPRDITIDQSGAVANEGVATTGKAAFSSEYTTWTALTDLNRGLLFVRTYMDVNYAKFDLAAFKDVKEIKAIPLAGVAGSSIDATQQLLAGKSVPNAE
ncbi:linear amide C-N hydrolase [Segnochrobactrum spirostomi]|nr:linear amide C-N hydrolase [Segnochrobactrum spirostomi]